MGNASFEEAFFHPPKLLFSLKDESTVKALKLRKLFVSSSVPRTLDAVSPGVWFIFTDACFDPEAF